MFAAAWSGCPNQASAPVTVPFDVAPQDLVPIGECAVVFHGRDGTVWIAAPAGLAKFPGPAVASAIWNAVYTTLAVGRTGVWVADTSTPFVPVLTLLRPDGPLRIQLPPRTWKIGPMRATGTGLLIATDTGDNSEETSSVGSPGAALLSIAPDGMVTTVWSARDAGIRALATDGTTTVMATGPAGALTGFHLLVDHGHGLKPAAAIAGEPALTLDVDGVAVSGDAIVVLPRRLTPHDAADVTVTAISRDRGATWTTRETPSETSPGPPLTFRVGVLAAIAAPWDATSGCVELTDTAEWKPYDGIPSPITGPGGALIRQRTLTTCGVWDLISLPDGDLTLTHTPLAGPGC